MMTDSLIDGNIKWRILDFALNDKMIRQDKSFYIDHLLSK